MRHLAALGLIALLAAACTSGSGTGRTSDTGRAAPTAVTTAGPSATGSGSAAGASARAGVPRFAHIVVVVEENHAKSEVLGSANAPYFNALARSGVVLTRSYGVTHPSYPNYLALFSGSTHGIRDDSCPHTYRSNNLGAQLRAHGLSFAGYAQGLPSTGYRGCTHNAYARKHVPWVDFSNLPRSVNRPMTAFPRSFSKLPRLSFVIPDLNHDMHDGTVRQADTWLRHNLARYVSWARTHNSLLIVTWDEDDRSAGNQIPGLIVGAHVQPGRYGHRVDHYRMLRTLEAAFGLPPIGNAAQRTPIGGIWRA